MNFNSYASMQSGQELTLPKAIFAGCCNFYYVHDITVVIVFVAILFGKFLLILADVICLLPA